MVEPKNEVCPTNAAARPLQCYDYTAHHHYAAAAHSCWRPHCDEKPSDAPPDEVSMHLKDALALLVSFVTL